MVPGPPASSDMWRERKRRQSLRTLTEISRKREPGLPRKDYWIVPLPLIDGGKKKVAFSGACLEGKEKRKRTTDRCYCVPLDYFNANGRKRRKKEVDETCSTLSQGGRMGPVASAFPSGGGRRKGHP